MNTCWRCDLILCNVKFIVTVFIFASLYSDMCWSGPPSVLAASVEAGRREANAKEIRARSHVSTVQAATISLRWLHVSDQVCAALVMHSLFLLLWFLCELYCHPLFIYSYCASAQVISLRTNSCLRTWTTKWQNYRLKQYTQ